MSEPFRILLTGGGTGGHVYPALAVVEAAANVGERLACRWVGGVNGLEGGIVTKAEVPFAAIDAGAVRGRSPVALVGAIARNGRGLLQARRIIDEFRPDVVLATGGFVCVPVVVAARLARVPAVVYLPDLRPGLAVRFLSRVATAVAVSFEEVKPFVAARRVEVTGYPVRSDLLQWDRRRARVALDLPPDEHVIVAIGGSRGARTINDSLSGGAETLLSRAVVIHASGEPNYEAVRANLERLPAAIRARYRLVPYLERELAPTMAAATVIVARAGASTLGELPAVGVPGVLVPYPHAGAHQELNAAFLRERGAAIVVPDQQARDGALVPVIVSLLQDQSRLDAMAEAARRLARPAAARAIMDLLRDVASSAADPSRPRRIG